ncbi:MAG: hypothetical protein ACLFRP_07990 [Puniceicoccaceae bacterium]
MVIFEVLILLPFALGLYVGLHAIVRPATPPNFDGIFKRRYRRVEWNERNPEEFTRKIGGIVLAASVLYGALILVPWILR